MGAPSLRDGEGRWVGLSGCPQPVRTLATRYETLLEVAANPAHLGAAIGLLAILLRGGFRASLQRSAQTGALRFAGVTADLATPEGFAALLKAQRDRAWVVYGKAPFDSPERVFKYLARYTHRVAISDRRILSLDDKGVTFRYRDNAKGGQKSMTLDGVEFLRRFLLQVLPTGFVRIRYYGLLANRHRERHRS